ncbi:hypothetical protein [Aneurinibacillus aneurinilyticus]|uniref:hypothetical protein n=1 Tax=Aneurinibacillus aneurinilyticus TaxID=1391 RepID=UPI00197C70A9
MLYTVVCDGKRICTRSKTIVATKFGVVRDAQGNVIGINGHPEYLRKAIEETVGAMSELVKEGKTSKRQQTSQPGLTWGRVLGFLYSRLWLLLF